MRIRIQLITWCESGTYLSIRCRSMRIRICNTVCYTAGHHFTKCKIGRSSFNYFLATKNNHGKVLLCVLQYFPDRCVAKELRTDPFSPFLELVKQTLPIAKRSRQCTGQFGSNWNSVKTSANSAKKGTEVKLPKKPGSATPSVVDGDPDWIRIMDLSTIYSTDTKAFACFS